jgi:hypothetical protein
MALTTPRICSRYFFIFGIISLIGFVLSRRIWATKNPNMSSTSTDAALVKSWAMRGETVSRLETKKKGKGGKEMSDSPSPSAKTYVNELRWEEASAVPWC